MGELPPNKNCGKEDCRRPTYCSCECGWAASSFSGGAQFKFSKKGEQNYCNCHLSFMHDRKEFEVQATILTIADFLVTDKPFPSVSSVKCNNTEAV